MTGAGATLALALVEALAAQENQPPVIRHQAIECVRPGGRALVCAQVTDDTGVAHVRVVFRAAGTQAYYWTPMAFEGSRYCATLPAPLPATVAVEYYVEALDDRFEPSRTAGVRLPSRPDCGESTPPRDSGLAVVGTTRRGQASSPAGFDPATFRVEAAPVR
jgi:hypothetical protein